MARMASACTTSAAFAPVSIARSQEGLSTSSSLAVRARSTTCETAVAKWSCKETFGPQVQALNIHPIVRLSWQSKRNFITRCMEAEEPTVDNSTVLVVGGGGVGLETIKALSMAGSWITGYQRSDKYRKDIEGLGAMLAIGDVLDTAAIEKTLRSNSFDAIVCTVGGGTAEPEVDKQGPINLIDAAKKAGVKRFILISSIGTGDSRKAIDDRTYGVLEKVLLAKEVAEDYLKESGLEYTIIRPGGLLSGAPPSGKGVLTEDSSVAGLISRTDVASLVLKILFDKRTCCKTYAAIDGEKIMPPGRPTADIEFLSLA